MSKCRRTLAGTFVLAGLLTAPPVGWAEDPGPETVRKRAEQKIAKLEGRLREAQPAEGLLAETYLRLAQHQTELARKLLARKNDRAADLMAEKAERFLAAAQAKEAQQ